VFESRTAVCGIGVNQERESAKLAPPGLLTKKLCAALDYAREIEVKKSLTGGQPACTRESSGLHKLLGLPETRCFKEQLLTHFPRCNQRQIFTAL